MADELPLNNASITVIAAAHGWLGLLVELELELGQGPSHGTIARHVRAGLSTGEITAAIREACTLMVRIGQHVESNLNRFILHLHESVWPDWDIIWTQMEEELRYLIHLHRKPLRRQDLAHISICKALGGQHFKSRLRKLELPPKMKAFFLGDIT